MPTYYARGITVKLGVLPLTDTVTQKIVLKKGDRAKEQCERAAEQLLKSDCLVEQRVRHDNAEGNFELHWLGGIVPYMQAQAGLLDEHRSFRIKKKVTPVDLDDTDRHTRTKPRDANEREPLALSLHVRLCDKSFRSGQNVDDKKHLKIEVFFNGQLSSCRLIPTHDITTGAQSMHQVYAGCRTDFLAERPWVLLPPGIDVDGKPQKQLAASATVKHRWNEICRALLVEADHRGTNSDGNIPPTAAFLKEVSSMTMPQQVAKVHDLGGRSFGVIDVVITAGDGRKVTSGTTYLKRPQRLPDPAFPNRAALFSSSQDAEGETDDDALQSDGADEQSDADRMSVPPLKRRAVQMDLATEIKVTSIQSQNVLSSSMPKAIAPASSSFSTTTVPIASMQRTPFGHSLSHNQFDGLRNLNIALPDLNTCSSHGIIPPVAQSGSLITSQPSMNRLQLYAAPDYLDVGDLKHAQSSAGVFSALTSSPLLRVSTNQVGLNYGGAVPSTPVLSSRESPGAVNAPCMSGDAVYPDSDPMNAFNTITPSHTQNFNIAGMSYSPTVHDTAYSSGVMPYVLPMLPPSGSFRPPLPAVFPFDQFNPANSSIKPPIGLLAVTTKPRRSQSPVKRQGKESSVVIPSDVHVSSIIIRGRGGVAVVDRRWSPPQKIACNRKIDVIPVIPETTVEATKPIKAEEKKRPQLAKSRSASTGILGIHGPKAPPIIIEDPEEMLRKRRKQSPMKREAAAPRASPFSIEAKATTSGANILDRLSSSSPLSSLTNTPEPQEGLGVKSSTAQLDGTFDLMPTRRSQPVVRAPSPTKSQLDNISHLRARPQHKAQSSHSPNTKKRKLGGGAMLPKQPRSPNRLTTTSNPLLNQNCVIAFAESADKSEQQGVLRQIKGERQGVFSEEYVVFACRYFIPGN